ncbi:flagellin domain protein [Rhodomicrobium vannielii ATCC 17100]|uniref:Flagellin n=1 Tax=Rhodomicrobium vannielii (strain ATCC 17100 / DSM 162 / LMG 4299 / NCIMB 10020 / ATH 3.1.1) TaxID=648757 RepID=E3I6R9_RHOVT|nr:flagellin [Rhodomicrobium vannielii]ADP71787.1 flagellin domain protein [Rhodomicrobium vannielii ATCC 17100]
MTSILTNNAANTALLNLQNTVKSLDKTQNEISTGLRVSTAADNASYYSIATSLKSDSSALTTISDSLDVADSTLATATSAIDEISDVLSKIKDSLVTATTQGADRTKIQSEIATYQAQLKTISEAASLNGQNFLSVDSSATGYNDTASFVASLSRSSDGSVSYGTITFSKTDTALFDSNGDIGILDKVDSTTTGSFTNADGTTATATADGKSVFNLDISALTDEGADLAMINAYQKQVEAAIKSVTAASSVLGSTQSRIESQKDFVDTLKTSVDAGVSSLVDADMNEASTRLSALQVQQELGVQALSIANESSQSILKLFQ